MRLVLEVPEVDLALVREVLGALAHYNAATYTCTPPRCLVPPWRLRYRPDEPAGTIILRDAQMLLRRGVGSCGELAAAYAGYLIANGRPTRVEAMLTDAKRSIFHAFALANDGEVFDPAELARRVA
jgi:hypothetical protein